MKRLAMILILYCFVSINYSNAVTISTENLGSTVGLNAMDRFGDRVVILGSDVVSSGTIVTYHPKIQFIDKGVMTVLPNYIISDIGEEMLVVNSHSRIKFDSQGNLWLTGKSLYKFEDNKWKEFFLSDEHNYVRSYGHLAIDANNNVWVTTDVFDKDNQVINFSELLMFNGTTFEDILQRKPHGIYTTYNSVIYSEKLSNLKDGRIVFHKTISRQGNELIDSLDGDFDLIIYEPGNTGSETYQIRTYNWDSSHSKLVNNLLPDNEKIWFALNGNVIPILDENNKIIGQKTLHRGLSVFDTKSKDWYIFDKKDGFPFDNPELPAPVKAITRVSDKLMLMNIDHKLYLIHQDYQVEETNWDLLLSDATIYKSSEHVTDDVIYETLDEIKKNQVEKLALIPRIHKMFVTPDNNLWILSSKFLIKSPIKLLSVTEQDSKEKEMTVFPNPSNDYIQINIPEAEISNVDVTNLYGNSVLEFKGQTEKLNISTLPEGIYFIKVQLKNGSILNNKFVKCNHSMR
jgi:hypothetical protein